MAARTPCSHLDTPENNETAGDAVVRYTKSEEDLTAKLQPLLDDPAARQRLAQRAKQRADAMYRWEAIAEKYEKLFAELVKR